MTESTYLKFEKQDRPGKKLPIYIVKNKTTDFELGVVKFCGAWRKFVFNPVTEYYDLIFDANCLSDIIIFLNDKTAEWRASLKKEE